MAALHFVQGFAMLAISSDFSLPVTTAFGRVERKPRC